MHITRHTPPSTWKVKADIKARRKTAYSATSDKLEAVGEQPAFTGDFEVTINWDQLIFSLAEKAARSKGKQAKALSGAITFKFKGPAK